MALEDWLIGGSSVLGGIAGAYGSNRAAQAQEDAAKESANAQRRNMMMQLQLQEPQRNFGYQALGDLSSLYGYSQSPYTSQNQLASSQNPLTSKQVKQLTRGGASFEQIAAQGTLGTGKKSIKRLMRAGFTPEQINQLRTGMAPQQGAPAQQGQPQGNAGNMSRFFTSPDYQFRRDEGQRDMGNSFAARGGAASGNALKALSSFNQNLASSEYGNYHSRLMQMAGMGSAATNNVAQAGNQYTQGIGQSAMAQGDARASGIMGGVNSLTGAINGGMNAWMMNNYLNKGG
jgi:hypothetical protein